MRLRASPFSDSLLVVLAVRQNEKTRGVVTRRYAEFVDIGCLRLAETVGPDSDQVLSHRMV